MDVYSWTCLAPQLPPRAARRKLQSCRLPLPPPPWRPLVYATRQSPCGADSGRAPRFLFVRLTTCDDRPGSENYNDGPSFPCAAGRHAVVVDATELDGVRVYLAWAMPVATGFIGGSCALGRAQGRGWRGPGWPDGRRRRSVEPASMEKAIPWPRFRSIRS
jgi:hypothetical protein